MTEKNRADAIFLYATEGIIQTDQSGTIILANPSAEKMFGYALGELFGKKIEILTPSRMHASHVNQRTKYNKNPHARSMGKGLDLYGARKDGSEFPVEISLSPYHTEEGNFVIAFIIDITQRKQAEDRLKHYSVELEKQVRNRTLILEEAIDELEKTKQELNEALEKERSLNELKSRFVSMASHEFRTPLATILSSLSLVTRYGDMNDKEKQNKHINRIKSSISNLTDILNDFLSVSKLEEGKVEYFAEEFEIREFMDDLISEMQLLLKEDQYINYAHHGNEIVTLDKKSLKNIVFNLISNAIKFSPEGTVIKVASNVQKGSFVLVVQDSGIGISETDQEHLFERFFRGHNASNIQGTGLGLNIVGRYVEQMNGHITFTSELNKGTTFTITFKQ